MHRPLADEIRPKSLDEVVGQRHLLAPGGVLRRLIDAGTDANMVFYGPSGTGKAVRVFLILPPVRMGFINHDISAFILSLIHISAICSWMTAPGEQLSEMPQSRDTSHSGLILKR